MRSTGKVGLCLRARWTHGAQKAYMLLLSKPEQSRLLRAGLASLQLSGSLTVTHIVRSATVIGYVNLGCRKAWSDTDALLCQ